MRFPLKGLALLGLIALAIFAAPPDASAQWTRVPEVPVADIFNVFTKGDTIVASSDSTVFVSLNAGATWSTTAKVAAGVFTVESVRVHRGKLYAGTHGQGVFVSSDFGATWQGFNQGLVGGFANSQLVIMDLFIRGDSLFAATGGSGAWIRNLATGAPWARYGDIFGPAQASNMESISGSPTRLFACAGFNGDAFFRDLGQPDWTETLLFNDHIAAGLAPLAAVWTGSSWLVGTNIGVFRSTQGQAPWTYTDFGLHPTLFASFATLGPVVFTHFASGEGTGIEFTLDGGVTWNLFDAMPGVFVYNIATVGTTMYGGRVDGLWRRPLGTVSVTPPVAEATGLHFAIAGANPIRDEARFRFELPEAGRVRIDVFDVTGRRMPGAIDAALPAGANAVRWDASSLAPGVYVARLSVAGRTETLRLVHAR